MIGEVCYEEDMKLLLAGARGSRWEGATSQAQAQAQAMERCTNSKKRTCGQHLEQENEEDSPVIIVRRSDRHRVSRGKGRGLGPRFGDPVRACSPCLSLQFHLRRCDVIVIQPQASPHSRQYLACCCPYFHDSITLSASQFQQLTSH